MQQATGWHTAYKPAFAEPASAEPSWPSWPGSAAWHAVQHRQPAPLPPTGQQLPLQLPPQLLLLLLPMFRIEHLLALVLDQPLYCLLAAAEPQRHCSPADIHYITWLLPYHFDLHRYIEFLQAHHDKLLACSLKLMLLT